MARVTQELIGALLRQQDIEFSTDSGHVNRLLASTISETPEAELLAAGRELIESHAARQRILGIRLLRELKEYPGQAAADLARLLRRETDEEVLAWIASAFGFLGSGLVTAELIGLAAHRDPGIRYHVATALANDGADDLPEESRVVLSSLARDADADVRFSAVFELGTWWQTARDPRIGTVLRQACADRDPAVARAAHAALSEGQN